MLTFDEALNLALRKYRELYPKGTLTTDQEDHMCLTATAAPSDQCYSVIVSFNVRGQSHPFVFFHANVNTDTQVVYVRVAQDFSILATLDFADTDFVT
jgi:hypothetical protein